MSTTSQWIDIAGPDGSFQAYLAVPHIGKGPAIILLQEIFGVNEHIRAVADQYAADGYVVWCPTCSGARARTSSLAMTKQAGSAPWS